MNKLKDLTDEELIQYYREKYPVPYKYRSTFKQPKFQKEQGIAPHSRGGYITIIKEAVEIEKVPGTICKFCLLQLLERDGILHNRLTYKYLMPNGKMKFGQYSLIAPESTIKRLFEQYYGL